MSLKGAEWRVWTMKKGDNVVEGSREKGLSNEKGINGD